MVHCAGPPGRVYPRCKESIWRRRGGCEGQDLRRRGRKNKVRGISSRGRSQEWVRGEEAEAAAKIAIVKVFFSVSQHSYLELLTQHFYQRILLHWGDPRGKELLPSFPPHSLFPKAENKSYLRGRPYPKPLKMITKTAQNKCEGGMWFLSRWKGEIWKSLKQKAIWRLKA